MRIISAEYAGSDEWAVHVAMVVDFGSGPVTGVMLVEIDGRDVEFEGDLDAHGDEVDWDAMWADAQVLAALSQAG